MKKYSVLFGLAILALIIDGSLSYDIFDTRPETLKVWAVLGLILVLGLIIAAADASKPPRDKDDPE